MPAAHHLILFHFSTFLPLLTTLRIGPLALPTYPLLILAGFYAALWVAARVAARRGLHPDHLYNAGLYAAAAALLGGRIGHVLAFFPAYRVDPLSILSPNLAAFQPVVALAAAALALWAYQRRHHLPPLALLDALVVGALALAACAALADALNGRNFGKPTMMPWAIVQWDVFRQPVQYYELAGTLLALAGVWRWLPRLAPGQAALAAVGGFAGVRLVVDAFREQALTAGDGFRVSQILALAVLLLVLLVFYQMQGAAETQERATPASRADQNGTPAA